MKFRSCKHCGYAKTCDAKKAWQFIARVLTFWLAGGYGKRMLKAKYIATICPFYK